MSVPEKISTLWIVIMFNIVFADILGFMAPGFLAEVQTGVVGGVTMTSRFLLVAALFLQIPILMIALTRLLRRRAVRIANYVAVIVTAAFVVGGGSALPHYLLFVTVELAAMLYILVLVYTWPEDAAWHVPH